MDLVFAPSQIETWQIARLRPYARNAKMHGDDQVAKIAASMAKFGWTVPCMVADDGELIAGHGRVLAATLLGLTEVPVIRLSHLDEAERRAYRIADNKLTELGEWDDALLRDEIAGLLAEDFDLTLLGISDDELDALLQDPEALGGDGPVEGEDDVPELPVTPVSVPGDLWQLGAHRLICGDSTSADLVGRLLGDVRPLLMVTDPPYGVEYDPSWRNQAGAAKTKRTGKVLNDDRADWREAWALFPGDVAYIWHGALHAATVADSLVAAGFAIRSQIIWAKDRLVLSRGDYHWQHEPCWYVAEFGWTVPCLVAADGELIAGHGRILAATQLGLAEVPVIVLGHLTEAQRRAYRIADNKLTELGGWDEALLLEELRGLMAEDFDLGLIGIPEDELDALLNETDDRAPIDDDTADTIPEAPAEPITRPGDIWALGDHRLICGDATDPAVVARLMDGAQASLLFTSPPYAQQRDYGAAKEKVGDWDALMQGVFAAAPVTADAQLLVNLGLVHRDGEWIPYWDGWVDWMRTQGWRRFGWYVWDQGPGLPGDWNGRLAPSHEFIFHFNRQPRKPNKTVESKHAGETLGGGGLRGADGTVHRKTGYGNAIQSHRIPDSVFRIMRHKGGLGDAGSHPAVFPVALVEAVLEAFTAPGDLVFEPFCGSGTQLIASERTRRRCCAVELDPVYCDVAVRRWELATGRTASRITTEEETRKPARRPRRRA